MTTPGRCRDKLRALSYPSDQEETGMGIGTRATAAVLFAGAAIAAVTVIPALTDAQTNGAREITVRMKVRWGAQVQHRGSARGDRLAPGDTVLTRLAMLSPDGAALGSAYSECVNVGATAD